MAELKVWVRVEYRRWWLQPLALAVTRWGWLLNLVLWLMPIDCYVGRQRIHRWRLEWGGAEGVISDG